MLAIIDYDAGNLKSVSKALDYLNIKNEITRDEKKLLSADKILLPGVGSFGDCMEKLKKYNLIDSIHELIAKDKAFLGICLGMQLLFDESEEAPGVKGLGILEGKIIKFKDDMGLKVPQIGWNSLHLQNDGRLYKGMEDEPYVYFVHSYHLIAKDEKQVKATCDYGVRFHASVEHKNIFGCQFHPEKSGDVGLKILKNFGDL